MIKRIHCAAALLSLPLWGCATLEQQKLIQQEQAKQQALLKDYRLTIARQEQQIQTLSQSLDQFGRQMQGLNEEFDELSGNLGSLQQSMSVATEYMKAVPESIEAEAASTELSSNQAITPEKSTLGRVEWAWVGLLEQYLKARIDTGAKSSSIHATDIQFFERDGQRWVMFKLHTHEETRTDNGAQPVYEAPLVRTVNIKQASSEGVESRAVIHLQVSVGELNDETEFTLTDRANMNYPILLGRNFLRDVAVVDVAQVFTKKRRESRRQAAQP